MLTTAYQRLRQNKWLLHSVTRRKNFYLDRVKSTSSMGAHLVRYLIFIHSTSVVLYSLGSKLFLIVKVCVLNHDMAGLQGFSGMNRFNTGAWSKVQCEMILGFLSYAEYFRPRYFLLENVRNFVSFNKGQTFRLTLATLIEMGYQVSVNSILIVFCTLCAS